MFSAAFVAGEEIKNLHNFLNRRRNDEQRPLRVPAPAPRPCGMQLCIGKNGGRTDGHRSWLAGVSPGKRIYVLPLQIPNVNPMSLRLRPFEAVSSGLRGRSR